MIVTTRPVVQAMPASLPDPQGTYWADGPDGWKDWKGSSYIVTRYNWAGPGADSSAAADKLGEAIGG